MSTIPISVIALMVWVMGPVPVLFGFGILAWCLVSIWLLVTGQKEIIMRETLSLLRLHHWTRSFWNGHYWWLIKEWGWKCIFTDTWIELVWILKRKTGARLAIDPQNEMIDKYLWPWQKMPKGYRWF